ncbi:MAG TPA: tripartite tricarboxylate transporter substrate binding protein [Bradyrhizobium sp.]|nr:tripartite tricarboxylate transporter substrate binding protein [Bradyrhizobium sp.]
MKPSRRRFLRLAAGAAVLPTASRVARAGNYPTRPIRWIVGFGAGTSVDIFARLIGQFLSERLGQPLVIENRPGAGGKIATEAVVRAAPDGYTLLDITSANVWNATIYDNLSYNFIRDIAPIAGTVRGLGVMEVIPSFPAKTVPEFIAYAKANPGRISFASSGVGTPQHLYGELFKMMAGIEMTHVPYRGSPQSLTGLFGGETQVIFDTLATSIEHIKAGRLRALAVTSASRSEQLPDVPTIGEFLSGYEATSWQGLGAPKGTPVEIIERLSGEASAAIADATLKSRIENLGYATFPIAAAELTRFIADETEKWAKVIRAANIKAN